MTATAPLYPSIIDEQLAELPGNAPRFYVENRGRLWHIIDRTTTKTAGFDRHHGAAVGRAQSLEKQVAP